MKSAIVAAAAFLALAPVAARAQAVAETPSIAVVGRGTVERDAEFQDLEVRLRSDGATQVAALGGLKAMQDRVSEGIAGLAGASRVRVLSDDFEVVQSYPADCDDDDYRGTRASAGKCAPVGYIARMNLDVRVYPASLAGPAASLASELGAARVEVGNSGRDDTAALRAEAARLAFEDARGQAELAARASGGRLGPVMRIQDGDASLTVDTLLNELEGVVVTGSRIPSRPSVAISVTPDKVVATTSLAVVFRLDR